MRGMEGKKEARPPPRTLLARLGSLGLLLVERRSREDLVRAAEEQQQQAQGRTGVGSSTAACPPAPTYAPVGYERDGAYEEAGQRARVRDGARRARPRGGLHDEVRRGGRHHDAGSDGHAAVQLHARAEERPALAELGAGAVLGLRPGGVQIDAAEDHRCRPGDR